MGDSHRFHLFADLVAERFPDRRLAIADVAAGKGKLKGELYRRGYGRVTAWDRRHKLAKRRPGQVYQLFDYRNAPRDYRLVIGMHPDEATDHIILYAIKHRVPFVVCPCCALPSASAYVGGKGDFNPWLRHLIEVARAGRMKVETLELPMAGRNTALIGSPSR